MIRIANGERQEFFSSLSLYSGGEGSGVRGVEFDTQQNPSPLIPFQGYVLSGANDEEEVLDRKIRTYVASTRRISRRT